MPRYPSVPISGKKLKSMRETRLFFSQAELGSLLGKGPSTIRGYEGKENVSVPVNFLRKLAELARMSLEDLMELLAPKEFREPPPPEPRGFDVVVDRNVVPYTEQALPGQIPTFDLAVAAGPWCDVAEVGLVCDPRAIDHGFFRVLIRGDSMAPRWKDGTTVEFRCLREGRDALHAGEDYYVQRDSEATFKRLHKFDDESMTLVALNRKVYPQPMRVLRADVVRMAIAEGEFKPKKRKG
jgi:SOS-response transcriptional repressor LexA